ncbi:HNH endonuclease signature motif containing protein [Arthrobacter koreensis]|uniref:HNH endonuclease signature motif containing protein n=1 Tax=Arthrobacter koreensis TaxID=199136 RepID=UPI002DBF2CE4|nr:DUF222 domain-containing protein [Arthrobacter koreensis]MEB7449233.1 HNH endonuclease [Arthrobacter koreensis]
MAVFHAEPGQTDTTDPDPLPKGFTGQLSLRGPETLGYDETVSTLQRLGILISWAQAQQARVAARLEVLFARDITEASGREEPALAMSLAAAEASTALNIPHMTAMQLISESTRLCTDAPQTLARLAEGKIALQHARIILDETHNLPTDILEEPATGNAPGRAAPPVGPGAPGNGEPGQLDLGLENPDPQPGPPSDHGSNEQADGDGPGDPAPGAGLTVRGAFERDLLAAAEGRTAAGFGRRARRLRESRFPDLIPVRHRQAKDKRRVSFQPLPDGMSCLSAIIAAEKGQAMFAALTGAAKAGKHAGDPRTMDQLRADTLTELLLENQPPTSMRETQAATPPSGGREAQAATPPTEVSRTAAPPAQGTPGAEDMQGAPLVPGSAMPGTRAGSDITANEPAPDPVPTPTPTAAPAPDPDGNPDSGTAGDPDGHPLSGPAGSTQPVSSPRRAERHRTQNRNRSTVRTEVMVLINADTLAGLDENPAELNGYGPISAETARAMILDALHWTPLIQDPATGQILTVGRTRRIPSGLKRWLQARDGTCRFPGCSVSVTHAEIDHTKPFSHGGPTDHANLEHLCPKHHRFKTLGHWTARQPEAGTVEWNSPTGRIYATDPALDYQPTPPTRKASNNPAESVQDSKHDPPPF